MNLPLLQEVCKLTQLTDERANKAKLNRLILDGEFVAAFLKTRVGTFYDKEILKYPVGLEATRNIVIDGTSVPVDAVSGRYVVQAGALMVNNTAAVGVNTVQTLNLPSDATTGTFQLQVPVGATAGSAGGGSVTAPIGPTPTAQAVQDALSALPNVGAGNVTVTVVAGTPPAASVYTITFAGGLAGANVPQLLVVNNTLNGTAAVATAVTTAGHPADASGKAAPAAASGVSSGSILGILTHTVEFFYPPEINVTDEPAAVYFHQAIFDSTKLINVSGNLTAVQAALPTCLFQ